MAFPVRGAGLRTRLCSFDPVFSVIVLTTFWLQRDGSSRINLSCVSLLCHYMHFQYMGWILQNNGDKCPLIGELYVYVRVMVKRILRIRM